MKCRILSLDFRILAQLKHPHIVAFHESFFDEDYEFLNIIQDYCDGGNMDDKIKAAAAVSTTLLQPIR